MDDRLPDSRLDAIERAADARRTVGDRVTIELVQEIRRLRAELVSSRRPRNPETPRGDDLDG